MNFSQALQNGCIPIDIGNILIGKGADYYADFGVFDIEVTNHKRGDAMIGIPYFWTFTINEEVIYYGRELSEFTEWVASLNPEVRFVIYVHNFAYEWQFIRKMLEWEDVFLIDRRRPLYARTINHIEFRCSYLLSNMSLNLFMKNEGCKFHKLSYDYSKKRYPWTPLLEEEMEYCGTDTAGLHEAIRRRMAADGDTVKSIPRTSTGYVRRDVKAAESWPTKNKIKRLNQISPDLYEALHAAFLGGNTHASRYYAGRILEDVTCYDIASSYPFAQISGLFPMNPFRRKRAGLEELSLDPKFAYLLKAKITEICVKPWDGMTQISVSKCEDVRGVQADNGRVLCADEVTLWMTDIEWELIQNHYDFESVEWLDCWFSEYGPLPDEILSVIYQYWSQKCTLKGVDDVLYRKSKAKLNSIYGMSAFDIGKRRFTYQAERRHEDGELDEYVRDSRQLSQILADVEGTFAAEPYIWGVWTTAIARRNLDEVIRRVGDRYIYCDTDSVYVQGELDLSEINVAHAEAAKEYEINGLIPGRWEIDKKCRRFITLGAKKYCYEDEKGVPHTVTAGVSKAAGVKRIEDYKTGQVFRHATSKAWYTDEETKCKVDGHRLKIPSTMYIEDSDYTLGITDTYRAVIAAVHPDREWIEEAEDE